MPRQLKPQTLRRKIGDFYQGDRIYFKTETWEGYGKVLWEWEWGVYSIDVEFIMEDGTMFTELHAIKKKYCHLVEEPCNKRQRL